jgi:hypothetical protein
MNRRTPDPGTINERLAERAAELCRALLGEPDVMTAEELRFGNLEVRIGGRDAGKWKIRSDTGALRDEGSAGSAADFLARPAAVADGGGR